MVASQKPIAKKSPVAKKAAPAPAKKPVATKSAAASAPSAILEKPYQAPPLVGLTGDGKPFNAASLKGHWAVVYFYPKDMTSGCTIQANDFQAQSAQFAKLGSSVVGISKDSCASHQKFATKESLKFNLLSDENGTLCENYGVWKEKSMYGRKYMGIERSTFLINPSGMVVAEWRKVSVTNHVAEVLALLKLLQG